MQIALIIIVKNDILTISKIFKMAIFKMPDPYIMYFISYRIAKQKSKRIGIKQKIKMKKEMRRILVWHRADMS